MKPRTIIALSIIVGAILFWWSRAHALPAGASFAFLETWDEYGAQSSVPAIAPYVTIDPATSSIVAAATVPWEIPGSNKTGSYLKIVPSGHNAENPGPTVATRAGQLGNPSQTIITYTWFRAEVAPSPSVAIFLWCDSSNPQGARGTDQLYLDLLASGKLQLLNSSNTVLATSGTFKVTFGTALTNWYLFETIITIGINSATGWQQGSARLNVYQSNGLRVDSISCTNCVTSANNNSFLIDQIAFDGEFDNTSTLDFGATWVINPGNNGAAAFVGPQYAPYTSPSGDSTPLQYAVTGAVHHWQAVSNVPPDSTKFVSTATQGNQDAYTANFPFDVDGITTNALTSFQESDANGPRLGTDISVDLSGTTTAGNQCSLINGTFTFCQSFRADAFMPTKIGPGLGW